MIHDVGIAAEVEALFEMKGLILLGLVALLCHAAGTLALLWYCVGPSTVDKSPRKASRRKSRPGLPAPLRGAGNGPVSSHSSLKKHRFRTFVERGAWKSDTHLLILEQEATRKNQGIGRVRQLSLVGWVRRLSLDGESSCELVAVALEWQ